MVISCDCCCDSYLPCPVQATAVKNILLGAEVAYDTAKADLTKYNFVAGGWTDDTMLLQGGVGDRLRH